MKALLLSLIPLIVACASPIPGQSEHATPHVVAAGSGIQQSRDIQADVLHVVSKQLGLIWGATDQIGKQLPPNDPQVQQLRRASTVIENKTLSLEQSLRLLDAATVALDRLKETVERSDAAVLEANLRATRAERAAKEAKEEAASATAALLRWIIGICVIGAGLSIPVSIFISRPLGVTVGLSAVACLIVATAVSAYLHWIAAGGLVVMALAAAIALWRFYLDKIALKEIVQTAEITKKQLPEEEKDRIFGDEGIADVIQSKQTKAIVREVRAKDKPAKEVSDASIRNKMLQEIADGKPIGRTREIKLR